MSSYTATQFLGVPANGTLQLSMNAHELPHVKLDIKVTILDM
jgi:hypothetical protein